MRYSPLRLLRRAWRLYREHGWPAVRQQARKRLRDELIHPLRNRFYASGEFDCGGSSYPYFRHPYNRTWYNERAIELPVAIAALDGADRVLEIGNVLAHYVEHQHDVVDKYEPGPGVRNIDVLEFAPPAPYDLIISISTLEHVGFDEDVVEPEAPQRAIARVIDWLAPGGRLVVTLPLGYNPHLDAWLRAGETPFAALHYLLRRPLNHWVETTPERAIRAGYDHRHKHARGLLIAEYRR